jgi:hypothetical protein
MFDVETLGVESNTVILSAAIIHFNPEDNPSYDDLLNKALCVKFDSKDQVTRLKRSIDKNTLKWWNEQPEYVRKLAFVPSRMDVSAEEGIQQLTEYVDKYNGKEQTMWARGSLDQMAIDSLAKKLDVQPITGYNKWRDVRTAIDIMYGTTNGYCKVEHPTFRDSMVSKHHPVHDCALDIMMLLYGKSVIKQ